MISFKRLARKKYVLYCTNATSVRFTVAKLTSCISAVKNIQLILFYVSEGKFGVKIIEFSEQTVVCELFPVSCTNIPSKVSI